MKDLNSMEYYKFFKTADIETASATITYVGKVHPNGDWMLQKIDTTSGIQIRYASVKNNTAYTTYASAWAARASLEYTTLDLI